MEPVLQQRFPQTHSIGLFMAHTNSKYLQWPIFYYQHVTIVIALWIKGLPINETECCSAKWFM